MSDKYIGFLHGQFGDLVMCSVACRVLKQIKPDSHLTFAVSSPYKNILPLFHNLKYIDDFHVWDGNDEGLSYVDCEFIRNNNYKVFDPFPKHIDFDWFNKRHYVQETLMMLGLPPTDNLACELSPCFGFAKDERYNNCVAISAFPSKSKQLNKTLDLDKWAQIVKEINNLGYKATQLGGKFDIQIDGAERPDFTFLEGAQCLYSSKLHITTDTSWAWIGSAFKCNTIGIWGYNYPNQNNIENHLPINPNAKYLYDRNVKNVDIKQIIKEIQEKLK